MSLSLLCDWKVSPDGILSAGSYSCAGDIREKRINNRQADHYNGPVLTASRNSPNNHRPTSSALQPKSPAHQPESPAKLDDLTDHWQSTSYPTCDRNDNLNYSTVKLRRHIGTKPVYTSAKPVNRRPRSVANTQENTASQHLKRTNTMPASQPPWEKSIYPPPPDNQGQVVIGNHQSHVDRSRHSTNLTSHRPGRGIKTHDQSHRATQLKSYNQMQSYQGAPPLPERNFQSDSFDKASLYGEQICKRDISPTRGLPKNFEPMNFHTAYFEKNLPPPLPERNHCEDKPTIRGSNKVKMMICPDFFPLAKLKPSTKSRSTNQSTKLNSSNNQFDQSHLWNPQHSSNSSQSYDLQRSGQVDHKENPRSKESNKRSTLLRQTYHEPQGLDDRGADSRGVTQAADRKAIAEFYYEANQRENHTPAHESGSHQPDADRFSKLDTQQIPPPRRNNNIEDEFSKSRKRHNRLPSYHQAIINPSNHQGNQGGTTPYQSSNQMLPQNIQHDRPSAPSYFFNQIPAGETAELLPEAIHYLPSEIESHESAFIQYKQTDFEGQRGTTAMVLAHIEPHEVSEEGSHYSTMHVYRSSLLSNDNQALQPSQPMKNLNRTQFYKDTPPWDAKPEPRARYGSDDISPPWEFSHQGEGAQIIEPSRHPRNSQTLPRNHKSRNNNLPNGPHDHNRVPRHQTANIPEQQKLIGHVAALRVNTTMDSSGTTQPSNPHSPIRRGYPAPSQVNFDRSSSDAPTPPQRNASQKLSHQPHSSHDSMHRQGFEQRVHSLNSKPRIITERKRPTQLSLSKHMNDNSDRTTQKSARLQEVESIYEGNMKTANERMVSVSNPDYNRPPVQITRARHLTSRSSASTSSSYFSPSTPVDQRNLIGQFHDGIRKPVGKTPGQTDFIGQLPDHSNVIGQSYSAEPATGKIEIPKLHIKNIEPETDEEFEDETDEVFDPNSVEVLFAHLSQTVDGDLQVLEPGKASKRVESLRKQRDDRRADEKRQKEVEKEIGELIVKLEAKTKTKLMPDSETTDPGLGADILSITRMWKNLPNKDSWTEKQKALHDDPIMSAITSKMQSILQTSEAGSHANSSSLSPSSPLSKSFPLSVRSPGTPRKRGQNIIVKQELLSPNTDLEALSPTSVGLFKREPGEGSSDDLDDLPDKSKKLANRIRPSAKVLPNQLLSTKPLLVETSSQLPDVLDNSVIQRVVENKLANHISESESEESDEDSPAHPEKEVDSDDAPNESSSQYLTSYYGERSRHNSSGSSRQKKKITFSSDLVKPRSKSFTEKRGSSGKRSRSSPILLSTNPFRNPDSSSPIPNIRVEESLVAYDQELSSPEPPSELRGRPKAGGGGILKRSEGSEGSQQSLGTASAFGSYLSLDSTEAGLSRAGSFPLLSLTDGSKKDFKMTFNSTDVDDMGDLFKVPARKARSEGAASEPESTDSDSDDDATPISCKYCKARQPLYKARLLYKLCHGCYTYYCGSECRRADWTAHKPLCIISRLSSLARKIFKSVSTDYELLQHCSRFARTGYLCEGRGAVVLSFSSPRKAQLFLSNAAKAKESALYLNVKDLAKFTFDDKRERDVLVTNCKRYNPDDKFVLHLAIKITRTPSTQAIEPRIRGREFHKNARLRLAERHHVTGVSSSQSLEDTLILTAMSIGQDDGTSAEVPDIKHREVFFASVQTKLRKRGISLRHQYPDVYNALCHYVTSGVPFSPISLFAFNLHTQKRFLCCLMPYADPENSWVNKPNLLKDLDLLPPGPGEPTNSGSEIRS